MISLSAMLFSWYQWVGPRNVEIWRPKQKARRGCKRAFVEKCARAPTVSARGEVAVAPKQTNPYRAM